MFKVQCSRSERRWNVEPGTLNLEHICAFTPPLSPIDPHGVVVFPLIMISAALAHRAQLQSLAPTVQQDVAHR